MQIKSQREKTLENYFRSQPKEMKTNRLGHTQNREPVLSTAPCHFVPWESTPFLAPLALCFLSLLFSPHPGVSGRHE